MGYAQAVLPVMSENVTAKFVLVDSKLDKSA